jgi:chromosomal replication initiation ATPase DnaA
MSELDRVMRLGRAYAGKARDLFDGQTAEQRAINELDEALEQGEIYKKQEQTQEFRQYVTTMTVEEAKIVLGVPADASFGTVKAQYQLLLSHVEAFEKTQPGRLEVAKRERDRIEKAFALLSSKVDSTEKRFGSLEID